MFDKNHRNHAAWVGFGDGRYFFAWTTEPLWVSKRGCSFSNAFPNIPVVKWEMKKWVPGCWGYFLGWKTTRLCGDYFMNHYCIRLPIKQPGFKSFGPNWGTVHGRLEPIDHCLCSCAALGVNVRSNGWCWYVGTSSMWSTSVLISAL